MMQQSLLTTFFLGSTQPRAWLVVRGEHQDCCVLEMSNGYPNHWSASLWLPPGDYRCRYYVGNDTYVFYQGPAAIIGQGRADGLDAVVSVSAPVDKVGAEPLHILVVEDNLTTLMGMEKLLKSEGYVVHIAQGYQTALEVARREAVHLAICDINLWDGDGCDLLQELNRIRPMSAIAVTGYTLPEETEHYRKAGFGTVLRKPFHSSDITSAVAALTAAAATGAPLGSAMEN
jgi:CheY-like chemotaxis protein